MSLIKNEYHYNSKFKKYVDEYCKKNKISVEEAFCKIHIKRMFWRYTDV